MAWSDKICEKIYGWIQYISENEDLDRGTSREFEVEQGPREAIDISDSELYH